MGDRERAVLYARISFDRTGGHVGVDGQLEAMRKLAAARDFEVVAELTDNDISASKDRYRPGFEEMWDLVRADAVDHVIVWQTSRLVRSRKERAEVIGTFGKHHVDVVAVQGPSLDLRTAYGRGVADLMTSFDTMESEVKGERVAERIATMARGGRPWGMVPYGWDRTDAGAQVVNAHEAAVVVELVDRLLAGESLNELRRDLNRRGELAPGYVQYMKLPADVRASREANKGRTPPPKAWATSSALRTIVVRDANIAVRRYRHRDGGGVVMPGDWPAIVDRDKHDRVVALMSDPARRFNTGPRPGARKHLLTGGVGVCGVCLGPLRVARRGGRRGNRDVLIYTCNGPKGCVGRTQEPVDALVELIVVRRLSESDALDLLSGSDTSEEARRHSKDAADLQGRLDAAAVSQAAGRIGIQALEIITEELQPQIDAAIRERDKALRTRNVGVLKDMAGPQAQARWDGKDVAGRRAVLEALGLQVVLLPRTKHGPGFEIDSVRFDWP